MIQQVGLFGFDMPIAVGSINIIKKRRKSVQDVKDSLRDKLKRLIDVPPKSLGSASVQDTRNWMDMRARARKVYKSERPSVQQLQSAVRLMEGGLQ